MGGRIWVESPADFGFRVSDFGDSANPQSAIGNRQPQMGGPGSAFHFTVRMGVRQGEEKDRRQGLPEGLEGLRVLAVDDNATNLRVLEETLSGWRMRPMCVGDGRQALLEMKRAVQDSDPFRLLLVDAMMPELDGFELVERIRRDPQLSGVIIMMLSSAERVSHTARCRELGIRICLTKPITCRELKDAVTEALSPSRREPIAETYGPVSRDGHNSGSLQGKLQILLAEDNLVNQRLAMRLLEKRGWRVEVAADGKEALRILEGCSDGEAFDLVLMDVQMPEMNGLEATAEIRRRERRRGGHIPIIAMTAHAMKGDRERCLEAGMDGYVAKPIQPAELFDAIDEVLCKDVVREARKEATDDRPAIRVICTEELPSDVRRG